MAPACDSLTCSELDRLLTAYEAADAEAAYTGDDEDRIAVAAVALEEARIAIDAHRADHAAEVR
jgi:hypothetical protein